jgi:hypothetical protein
MTLFALVAFFLLVFAFGIGGCLIGAGDPDGMPIDAGNLGGVLIGGDDSV